MRRCLTCLSIILALVVFLTLSGCASSGPSRFYTLSALGDKNVSDQKRAAADSVSVGIVPVEIPDYLDRPQIVTRTGPNELKLAEYDRWAGSLSENITTVLRENLSLLLNTARVFEYPWNPSLAVDYKVTINVIRLESVPGDHVILRALWTVSGGKEGRGPITRVTAVREKLDVPGYDALVAAISRVFGSLSREIAAEINAAGGNGR
jgi:uncharacterized lipoprotein YmbA